MSIYLLFTIIYVFLELLEILNMIFSAVKYIEATVDGSSLGLSLHRGKIGWFGSALGYYQ